MHALFELAMKHDCSRVEWQTEATSQDAHRFYVELGVPVFEGKAFYRLEGDKLRRAAGFPVETG